MAALLPDARSVADDCATGTILGLPGLHPTSGEIATLLRSSQNDPLLQVSISAMCERDDGPPGRDRAWPERRDTDALADNDK